MDQMKDHYVRTGLSGPWAQFDETSEQQQAGYDYWFKHVAPILIQARVDSFGVPLQK